MSTIDWGLLANVISAIAALGTLVIAAIALGTWRKQARGSVAQETMTAARAMRYAFYDARSPFISAWEFPTSYWEGGADRQRSNTENADAHWHVYRNRLQQMWPHGKVLADLRAKCGANLGDEVADAVENIARGAQMLQHYMEEYVSQLRAGPEAVAQWADQDYVQKAKDAVCVDPQRRDDAFSRDFEAKFDALQRILKPHL